MNCNVCHKPLPSLNGPCPACLAALVASGKSPPAGLPERAWVLRVRTETDFTFIVSSGRLVLFESREDAEHALATLMADGCAVADVGIENVAARTCWAYTVLRGLILSRAERKFNAERN